MVWLRCWVGYMPGEWGCQAGEESRELRGRVPGGCEGAARRSGADCGASRDEPQFFGFKKNCRDLCHPYI